ncbi:hypothetical protein [Nonomuraea sp. NPDC023979]|uniref:hypothetical protein n=1 Tax=Nonomuraea sp. NPDC023979 TaxID=3154796 RepID=UPI00340087EC
MISPSGVDTEYLRTLLPVVEMHFRTLMQADLDRLRKVAAMSGDDGTALWLDGLLAAWERYMQHERHQALQERAAALARPSTAVIGPAAPGDADV